MSDIALPITAAPGPARGRRLLSDERLAKLAGRGDARAFVALYQRNHQSIYRYCRSILRHDQDAQDALQSTMMRAYTALRAQQRDVAVRPWLFRIAHNEAISILRRRAPTRELSEELEHLDDGVHGALETRERLSTLVADLQALPERQRGALLMRELSGLSIEEIAQALTISTAVAKQTLFEARGSLRELAEGRAMSCELVTRAISDGDGRVLRGRRIRAHLRACEECRSFKEAIDTRTADLHALFPLLPAGAAGALLARLLAHGAGHSGASAGGLSLGGHAAGSMLTKGLAGVTIAALAAAGTARLVTHHHHRAPAGIHTGSGRSSQPHGGSAYELSTTVTGRLNPGSKSAPALAGSGHSVRQHTRAGAWGPATPRPASATPGLPQAKADSLPHAHGNARPHAGEKNRSTGRSGHGHHASSPAQDTKGNGRAHHRPHGSTPRPPKHETKGQEKRQGGHGSGAHHQSASSQRPVEAQGAKGTGQPGESQAIGGHGRGQQAQPQPPPGRAGGK